MTRTTITIAACWSAFLGATLWTSTTVRACPFCSAQSQTLSEEIATVDAVVLVDLVEPAKDDAPKEDLGKAMFVIKEVIVGTSTVKVGDSVQTIYFGSAKPGASFLLFGVDPPNIAWTTPTELTDRSKQYIRQLVKLPKEGVGRLQFFQEHLEDKEPLLAQDSYDEFARAPYADVQGLKDEMDHDQLLKWIQDSDVPASRRRLYLTMLGVCGTKADLPMLEKMLSSSNRRLKAGLDAMVACYLTIKGSAGLPLIEDLFLKDADTEYSDTYAAIMALRFHGTEGNVIPKKDILKSLHFMLDRPNLADLVIPDLARWEDWSQMDRLVDLFKNADEKSSWVKVPVINYLRACPEEAAKKHLETLAKLDPETVERANTFFPFAASTGAKAEGGDAKAEAPKAEEKTKAGAAP